MFRHCHSELKHEMAGFVDFQKSEFNEFSGNFGFAGVCGYLRENCGLLRVNCGVNWLNSFCQIRF